MNDSIRKSCPICGESAVCRFWTRYGRQPLIAGRPVHIGERPRIFECESCDIRFTEPRPDVSDLSGAYESAGTDVWKDDPRNVIRRGYRRRVDLLTGLCENSSVLDIGCYTGEFLDCFPEGWARYGIEPSREASAVARERGVNIIASDLGSPELAPGSFGLITAMNVVEHIARPADFMHRVQELLVDGGVLFIETGDYKSGFARAMAGFWSYQNIAEHVTFFSLHGLVLLFRQYNFDILATESGFFHKRPLGYRAWMRHFFNLTRAVAFRMMCIPVSAVTDGRRPDDVPWVTHMDHMYVIGRKPGVAQADSGGV